MSLSRQVRVNLRPDSILASLVCFLLAAATMTTPAAGDVIYSYSAATDGAAGGFLSDWYLFNNGVNSNYVDNVANTGIPAMRMSTSTYNQYGFYVAPLFPSMVSAAQSEGWRFETEARYEIPAGLSRVDRNFGLQVTLNDRIYILSLGHATTGQLRATLWNTTGLTTHTLTSNQSATEAFHNFAFQYDPGNSQVSFEFNGEHIAYTNGLSGNHPDSVEWGNFGQQPGILSYSDVKFTIGSVASLPGDYNGDGVVNGADYTVWADSLGSQTRLDADGNGDGIVNESDRFIWRSNFGNSSTSSLLLNSTETGVPEPASLVLLSVSLISVGIVIRRQRTSAQLQTP